MTVRVPADEVMEKLRSGWSLWKGHNGRRFLLQEGKQGHGGKTIYLHGQTVHSLERKGMINPPALWGQFGYRGRLQAGMP